MDSFAAFGSPHFSHRPHSTATAAASLERRSRVSSTRDQIQRPATREAAAPWERHPGRLCRTTTPRFIPVTETTPGWWWPSSPPFANEDVDEPFADEPGDDTDAADTFHEPLAEHKAENSVDWSAEFKQCFSELRQSMCEHFQQLVTAWLDAQCAEGTTPTTPIYNAAANDFSHLDGEPVYDNYDDNEVIYDVFADEVTAAIDSFHPDNAPISDDTDFIPANFKADAVSDGRICTDPPPKLADLLPLNSGAAIRDGEFISDDDNTATNIVHDNSNADGWICLNSSPKMADLSPLDSRDASCDNTPIYDQYGDDDADEVFDALFDLTLEEEYGVHQPTPAAESRLSSGLFHNRIDGGVAYNAVVPGSVDMKMIVPDPAFSACKEEVTILASTDGLVCLLVNPTFKLCLGYTTSGMPSTCSMECFSLTAATDWVFRVAECFTFDPGITRPACCSSDLEPWPPPFPVYIIYSVSAIRPLPWPSFCYHEAREHLSVPIIVLPTSSILQQQQQAAMSWLYFTLTDAFSSSQFVPLVWQFPCAEGEFCEAKASFPWIFLALANTNVMVKYIDRALLEQFQSRSFNVFAVNYLDWHMWSFTSNSARSATWNATFVWKPPWPIQLQQNDVGHQEYASHIADAIDSCNVLLLQSLCFRMFKPWNPGGVQILCKRVLSCGYDKQPSPGYYSNMAFLHAVVGRSVSFLGVKSSVALISKGYSIYIQSCNSGMGVAAGPDQWLYEACKVFCQLRLLQCIPIFLIGAFSYCAEYMCYCALLGQLLASTILATSKKDVEVLLDSTCLQSLPRSSFRCHKGSMFFVVQVQLSVGWYNRLAAHFKLLSMPAHMDVVVTSIVLQSQCVPAFSLNSHMVRTSLNDQLTRCTFDLEFWWLHFDWQFHYYFAVLWFSSRACVQNMCHGSKALEVHLAKHAAVQLLQGNLNFSHGDWNRKHSVVWRSHKMIYTELSLIVNSFGTDMDPDYHAIAIMFRAGRVYIQGSRRTHVCHCAAIVGLSGLQMELLQFSSSQPANCDSDFLTGHQRSNREVKFWSVISMEETQTPKNIIQMIRTVMKQRLQVQGTRQSWLSAAAKRNMLQDIGVDYELDFFIIRHVRGLLIENSCYSFQLRPNSGSSGYCFGFTWEPGGRLNNGLGASRLLRRGECQGPHYQQPVAHYQAQAHIGIKRYKEASRRQEGIYHISIKYEQATAVTLLPPLILSFLLSSSF